MKILIIPRDVALPPGSTVSAIEGSVCLHFEFEDGRQIQVYVRENGLCVSAVCGGRLVIEPGAQNTMQVSAVLP